MDNIYLLATSRMFPSELPRKAFFSLIRLQLISHQHVLCKYEYKYAQWISDLFILIAMSKAMETYLPGNLVLLLQVLLRPEFEATALVVSCTGKI